MCIVVPVCAHACVLDLNALHMQIRLQLDREIVDRIAWTCRFPLDTSRPVPGRFSIAKTGIHRISKKVGPDGECKLEDCRLYTNVTHRALGTRARAAFRLRVLPPRARQRWRAESDRARDAAAGRRRAERRTHLEE